MRTMRESLKRIAGKFPPRLQQRLRRLRYSQQIHSGDFFKAHEPEYYRLEEWVKAGDFVVDVGANIGQYTARLSMLVGAAGRVLAFEPVPETFELLTANLALVGATNVTLLNAAVSGGSGIVGMSIPKFDTGLNNHWAAFIAPAGGHLKVMSLSLDSLSIPTRVSLVKIDVEGHEFPALMGMRELLKRDHPTLIVEGWAADVEALLSGLGYSFEQAPGCWNRVFTFNEARFAQHLNATGSTSSDIAVPRDPSATQVRTGPTPSASLRS
jgi:FkbM family methyltransferase